MAGSAARRVIIGGVGGKIKVRKRGGVRQKDRKESVSAGKCETLRQPVRMKCDKMLMSHHRVAL